MKLKIVLIPLLAAAAAAPDIVGDVRAAIAQNNFTLGESLLQRYQAGQGVTPEMIEALSWLGRGALATGQLDPADGYAERTRKMALEQLAHRKLDAEPHLPLALGASIEVQAQTIGAARRAGRSGRLPEKRAQNLLDDVHPGSNPEEHSPIEPGRQACACSRCARLAGVQAASAGSVAR